MQDFLVLIGNYLSELFNNLFSVDRWYLDVIDIALVALIIYYGIKFVKDTRAAQLVKGIFLFLVFFFFASVLKLTAMYSILRYIFQYGLVALALIFQPEIRRALEKIGRSNISVFDALSKHGSADIDSSWSHAIDPICEACHRLSVDKIGALIVIERKIRLGESVERAVVVDSIPSVSLITNLFFPNSPLHDGGLIVRDGRLYAASCFFQPSDKVENISLGSRHRAALGVSEVSDAIVIIVSEETGIISVATEGQLTRNYTKETLKELLNNSLLHLPDNDDDSKGKKTAKIKKALERRKDK